MQAPIGSVRVDLPLPVSANAETVVNLWKAQSALLKQCPAYPTTPAVESAVTDADAAVVVLDGTCAKLGQLWAQIKTLETTRETQVATVRLKHDAVETACNTASNNDPEAAKAWTGKTKSRAKPVLAAASNGPPENPALRSIKKQSGSVRASCTPEAGAVGYLCQTGADPSHPESWPAPVYVHGHTFTFRGLPVGQPFYARIAVVRRGSVQGAWSPVLQITVK